MIKVNGILDLKNDFDIFIFDAYGVFWNGSKFYEGSREAMKELIDTGKIVYILSNATLTSDSAIENYTKHGLLKGIHYNEFITSGDILKSFLLEEKLKFKNEHDIKNVYILGSGGKNLFEGTKYNVVNDLKNADFVYTSVPKLNEDGYNKSIHKNVLFESKDGHEKTWNSITVEPFIEELDKVSKSKLPVLNGNPDFTARIGTKSQDENIFAIRNGSFAEYLRTHESEVIEFGKPNKITYDFLFNKMESLGTKLPKKSKICMIGDTLRTDIKGANNAGIKSILCIETGVTANEIKNGKTLEELIEQENVVVDYTILSVSGL